MTQTERRIFLIRELLRENPEYRDVAIPSGVEGQKQLLRGLMNIRPPRPAGEAFQTVQDDYLRAEIAAKGITDAENLKPVRDGLYLWQGDITTLRCDAIVNAANSGMTGCYVPNHRCIDNAAHTFAGVQLRLECDRMMRTQGYAEPAGRAKLTPGYNLPCRYILHTVGPIVSGRPTGTDCEQLKSCYRSCLELAAENGLQSVVFCCISTGEFHFPAEKAAEIAIATVEDFMQRESGVRKVIFNVFKDSDRGIYRKLLGAD